MEQPHDHTFLSYINAFQKACEKAEMVEDSEARSYPVLWVGVPGEPPQRHD